MTAMLDDEVAKLHRANAELQRRLDECMREREEAEAQKVAMAEVLQVINSSPGDLTPVFDAILEKATSLCEAAHGNLWTYDGERFYPVATHGNQRYAEWLRQRGPVAPASGAVLERIVQGGDRDHWCPHCARCAVAQRQYFARRHFCLSSRSPPVLGQADRVI